LGGETADLGIERGGLRRVRRRERADHRALLEAGGQTGAGRGLPLAELGGRDAVRGGEMCDGVLSEEVRDDRGIDGCRALRAHG
jgi:hypothetical protein